jgi:hypothetical protein
MSNEDSSWHIIPVCFRVRGGVNGHETRYDAAEMLRGLLNAATEPPLEQYFIPEWWFPNDPANNTDGEPRDGWHLEWAEGPVPEDLGDNVVRREE